MRNMLLILYYFFVTSIFSSENENYKAVRVIWPSFDKAGYLKNLFFEESDESEDVDEAKSDESEDVDETKSDESEDVDETKQFFLHKNEYLKTIIYDGVYKDDYLNLIIQITFVTNTDRRSPDFFLSPKTQVRSQLEKFGYKIETKYFHAGRGQEIYGIKRNEGAYEKTIIFEKILDRPLNYDFMIQTFNEESKKKSKEFEQVLKQMQYQIDHLNEKVKNMEGHHEKSRRNTLGNIKKTIDTEYKSIPGDNLISSINHMLTHKFSTDENLVDYIVKERRKFLNQPINPFYKLFQSDSLGGDAKENDDQFKTILMKAEKKDHVQEIILNLIANVLHHDIYVYDHKELKYKIECQTEKHSYDIDIVKNTNKYNKKASYQPTTAIIENDADARTSIKKKMHETTESALRKILKHNSDNMNARDKTQLMDFMNSNSLQRIMETIPGPKRKHIKDEDVNNAYFNSIAEELLALGNLGIHLETFADKTRTIIISHIDELNKIDENKVKGSKLNKNEEHMHMLLMQLNDKNLKTMIKTQEWVNDDMVFELVNRIVANHYTVNIEFFDHLNNKDHKKSLHLNHKVSIKLIYDGHHYHSLSSDKTSASEEDTTTKNVDSKLKDFRRGVEDYVEKNSTEVLGNVLNKLPFQLSDDAKDHILTNVQNMEANYMEKLHGMEDKIVDEFEDKVKDMLKKETKVLEKSAEKAVCGLFRSCTGGKKEKFMKL